jgi:hypothetical protein
MAEFAKRLIHIYDGKLANGDGAAPSGNGLDGTKTQLALPEENTP